MRKRVRDIEESRTGVAYVAPPHSAMSSQQVDPGSIRVAYRTGTPALRESAVDRAWNLRAIRRRAAR